MTQTASRLSAATRLGATALTVTDLDRSLAFYQDALGLRVHRHADGEAALGSGGDDVLVLVEMPGARPAGRHAGLYHVALLYPSRLQLAYALDRIVRTQTPIEGMSDHGTHEAIYLPDPDGNGLELAADRPRAQWPDLQRYGAGPSPLDVQDLYSLVDAPQRFVGPGLTVGHLHLHVGDVDAARAFYRDVIGFDVTMEMPTAVFLSAGGYHHHVAANVWRGRGVPPAPADAVGLRYWTVLVGADFEALRGRLESYEERDGGLLVRDPSGNAILLKPGRSPSRDGHAPAKPVAPMERP
jgi:catechol 2,3-dioxygenase